MLAVLVAVIAMVAVSVLHSHQHDANQQQDLNCAYAQVSDPSVVCK